MLMPLALPPLKIFAISMRSWLPELAVLLTRALWLELDRKFNNLPVSAASTNARRQAEIGALCWLVMRWMIIVELAPVKKFEKLLLLDGCIAITDN